MMIACPICKSAVARRQDNSAFPFCTPRCKQTDLNKWLSEDYRVPTDENENDNEGSLAS